MALVGKNLLDEPAPTYLSKEAELEFRVGAGDAAENLVKEFPKSSRAWALLAQEALASCRTVEGYAYARVGYHRGLDALRAHGWKGHGPIPFSHEPNRGFLTALYLLGQAAVAIGEVDEAERIEKFLDDSDPTAKAILEKQTKA